jgi:acyl-CoA thioesterase I
VRRALIVGWLAAASGVLHSAPAPVIVAFGDSLTAGFGVEPGLSWPDDLAKLLHQKVINAGVSGDTTTDGLNRLPEVIGYHPKIVIVEFGGNDGLRGLPLTTTRANLDQIIQSLQKAGAHVLLAGMTLPPNYGPEYIHSFEAIYKDLARKYKVPLIPFLLEGVALKPGMMQRDGIHPTAAGHEIVARTVLRYLKGMR